MIGCLDGHRHVPTRTFYDAPAIRLADVIATASGRCGGSSARSPLSAYREINRELPLGSGTAGKGRRRRAERRRDVVRIGEVSRVRGDSPPTVVGAVLDAGAE